jgi:hypothetical protein
MVSRLTKVVLFIHVPNSAFEDTHHLILDYCDKLRDSVRSQVSLPGGPV